MSTVFIILLVILLIIVGIILIINIGIRFAIFTARTVIDIIKSPASLFFIMCFIVLAILGLLINQKSAGDSSYDRGNDIPVATEYKRSLPEKERTHFNTSEANTPTRETQEEPIHIEETPEHKPIMDFIEEVPNTGVVYDAQGNEYKTVKIGEQIWMAENLNLEISGSWCYENKPSNCKKYGRLYTWKAAMENCPDGWHLPSKTEWKTLINAVGEPSTTGSKLKSSYGWYRDNGTDAFGFSALPAGLRYDDGSYDYEGTGAQFWSSTEFDISGSPEYYGGRAFHISLTSNGAASLYDYYQANGLSVRCVKQL